MNYLLLCPLFFISFIGFGQLSDSAIVIQLNQKWITSYAIKDTATMQQTLADDFVLIAPKGNKRSRMDVIDNVGTKDNTTIGTIDSACVRIFGNTHLLWPILIFR